MYEIYHKANKKMAYYDDKLGLIVEPEYQNAYKFELFIHQFLNFCEEGRFGVLCVDRQDEFAPVKNEEGKLEDSPNTARQLVYR